MNYSRHITKAAIRKRLLTSWVIVGFTFFVIGFGSGWGCKAVLTGRHQDKEPQAERILIYGQYDGIIFEINYSKSVFQYQQKFKEEIERRKEE